MVNMKGIDKEGDNSKQTNKFSFFSFIQIFLDRFPSDTIRHRRMDDRDEILHTRRTTRRSAEVCRPENYRRYESTVHSALDCAYVGSIFWLDHLRSILNKTIYLKTQI